METANATSTRPALRLVTDDLLNDAAWRTEQENLAVARRLVDDPRLGIRRVTVVGSSGTYTFTGRLAVGDGLLGESKIRR
jgi:hypothetical protein